MNVLQYEIVLFDGYCNFCTGWVRFIIPRDTRGRFRFAAAQTGAGERLVQHYGLGELAEHSLVLISGSRIYDRSDAALRIARRMKGLWPLFFALLIIPRFIRDFFYGIIARNRFRISGRREACFVPDESLRERFL